MGGIAGRLDQGDFELVAVLVLQRRQNVRYDLVTVGTILGPEQDGSNHRLSVRFVEIRCGLTLVHTQSQEDDQQDQP
jgi:hypothetical protein